MIRLLCGIALVCSLAACNFVETSSRPTPTATRALSGPTLAPSPTVAILPVTELPDDLGGYNDPTAAALPRDLSLPPLPASTQVAGSLALRVQFPAEDGVLLEGDLYQQGSGRLPGILLIGPDPSAWGDLPLKLMNTGYTVLVMPLRQPAQLADFNVILEALSEVGTVNPGRIGVIGAETGADMALIGCAVNLLCDVAALLSPSNSDSLLNIIVDYNPRPLLLVASQNDPDSFAAVEALRGLATGEILVQPFDNAGRGAAMLQARPDLADLIVSWFTRYLTG